MGSTCYVVLVLLCNTIGYAISSVANARLQQWVLDAPFQVLLALDYIIGCAISSAAGAGLHYWMHRFICWSFDNSAGVNSKLTTLIACAANSVCTYLYKLSS
jgi:hypothetical protein